ncbi:YihY/virulence factor BrkB family protein [Pontibaca salina]|uniref:YihY/virulence factor BrkB family protein n=1 Tax=Pontibaca salina TaxID=2795731 RepID=UPI002FCDD6E4
MDRGRHPETPSRIPAKGWKDIAMRLKCKVTEDHVTLISAGVAFYALLALFPAITAFIAIAGLVLDPSDIVAQLDDLSGFLPADVSEIVIGQAQKVAGSETGGLGLAAIGGILIALYSASKGVGSLLEGLNVAYDEKEKRGFIKLKALTFGLTLLLIIGFILAIGLTLALPAVLGLLPLGAGAKFTVTAGSLIVMLILLLLGLSVMYCVGPSRDRPEWKWVTPGAVSACLLWIAASAGFSTYVSNFSSYNESFGSLAGIIVLLLWLWISALVVLLGAEINAAIEAQTGHDTTSGAG